MTPEERARLRDVIERYLITLDCGDSSCLFAAKKTGMRTNGGCRCLHKQTPPPFVLQALAMLVKAAPGVLDALEAAEARDAARIARVGEVLTRAGCECECGHNSKSHSAECYRCVGCRVAAVLADTEKKQ